MCKKMQEVIIDLSTFYASTAKLTELSSYIQKARDLAGNGNVVVLTGAAPVWLYLKIAHVLYEKAWKLIDRSPVAGDMEIFTHSPVFYDYKKGDMEQEKGQAACREVVIDLSTFWYPNARFSDLSSKIHEAVELASEDYDRVVVLTGEAPVWLYLKIANALEGEVKNLIYRPRITDEVEISGQRPCREFIVNLAPEGTACGMQAQR